MKKILLTALAIGFLMACDDDSASPSCTYNGKTLYKGPEGGCYYNNSNGNKTYVDRSYCNCK